MDENDNRYYLKRPLRKKSGHRSLCRTLKALLAQTPLIKNLQNQDYMQLLLKDKDSLEKRFAQIDATVVRTYLAEQETSPDIVPRRLQKWLALADLPQKLLQNTKSRLTA